jgi:hypothetical protein
MQRLDFEVNGTIPKAASEAGQHMAIVFTHLPGWVAPFATESGRRSHAPTRPIPYPHRRLCSISSSVMGGPASPAESHVAQPMCWRQAAPRPVPRPVTLAIWLPLPPSIDPAWPAIITRRPHPHFTHAQHQRAASSVCLSSSHFPFSPSIPSLFPLPFAQRLSLLPRDSLTFHLYPSFCFCLVFVLFLVVF